MDEVEHWRASERWLLLISVLRLAVEIVVAVARVAG